MTTQDELKNIPQAASVSVFFCENPRCLRPHVLLRDDFGLPIIHFVVPDPQPDHGFMFDLQEALRRSAVERGREHTH